MKRFLLPIGLFGFSVSLGLYNAQAATSLPTLTVADAAVTENETYVSLNVPIVLSKASTTPVSVKWTTQNATAVAGSDYDSASGTIAFKPGQTQASVRVIVRGDKIEERDETFRIILSAPQNAILADSTGVISINDNDYAGRISVTDVANKEGNAGTRPFDFKISLSKAPLHPLAIRYATGDGSANAASDYTATMGTLVIKPSQQAAYVKVPIVGDTALEADEKFTLKLSGSGLTFSKATGIGTILNDDAPKVPSKIGKIVFTSTPSYYHEMIVVNADGTNLTRLTNNQTDEQDAVFSPDGRKIAFSGQYIYDTSYVNHDIFVMNADGSGLTRLTDATNDKFEPSFSPDSQQIVFSVFEMPGKSQIYLMNADGTNQRRLSPPNSFTDMSPSFAPDGQSIVFSSSRGGHSQIYIMDEDGGNQRLLSPSEHADSSPAFSPDGTKIAFDSIRSGISQIYIMNADGTNRTTVTNMPHGASSSTFSPDGSSIAFYSLREGTGYSDIYVMNIEGSTPQRVTTPDGSFPSWAPGYVPAPRSSAPATRTKSSSAHGA